MINPKVLLSYYYFKGHRPERELGQPDEQLQPLYFADSGAFSALTLGAPITIEGYATWLEQWKPWLRGYSNLDVIGDAKGTWYNQQWMEDHGFTPVPTFHVGEEWSWLEHYLKRYKYIALGVAGMQEKHRAVMSWLGRAFTMAQSYGAVFHGFALTSWTTLRAFPFYSVDSSSWSSGLRFATLKLFDSDQGRFVRADYYDPKTWGRLAWMCEEIGVDARGFMSRATYRSADAVLLGALAFAKAEQWLREHRPLVPFPGGTQPDGPHIMLAMISHDLRIWVEWLRKYNGREQGDGG